MTATARPSSARDPATEPAWEIAQLFPGQGEWTEAEYFALPGNRLIELSEGRVEVLPMPTTLHQMVVAYLYRALDSFVRSSNLGIVLFSALPVRLWEGKFREPDVLFMSADHKDRLRDRYWDGADLVMEVVSENDPRRDLETKRSEYARAGIPEYWIVDPKDRQITVLKLESDHYVSHGAFTPGQRAASALLAGFEVDVELVFAAATL